MTKESNYVFPNYICDNTSISIAHITASGASLSFLSFCFYTSSFRILSKLGMLFRLMFMFPIFYSIFPIGFKGLSVTGLSMTLSMPVW